LPPSQPSGNQLVRCTPIADLTGFYKGVYVQRDDLFLAACRSIRDHHLENWCGSSLDARLYIGLNAGKFCDSICQSLETLQRSGPTKGHLQEIK